MNTEKLKLFFEGRKGLLPKIEAACRGEKDIIWFHVASYGEFEEARPVIEATRARFPGRKILMTVFSPTVYFPMQHYDKVDWVFYLPLDLPWDVNRFLDIVRPSKAIFTITDFWPVLLNALRRRSIDTYIMSVHLDATSYHLKWYSFNFKQIFRHCYKTVMVRDRETYGLLKGIGVADVRITGDPRMDRVMDIGSEPFSNPVVEAWSQGKRVFIAGSTYEIEDKLFSELANAHPDDKFMIIPHEIEAPEVDAIIARARHGAVRYTDYEGKEADDTLKNAQLLVVNTVGMLARLYRYGYAAYVGAGFTDANPHSVVEPAIYGLPVVFGPHYAVDNHCKGLIAEGAGFSIGSLEELSALYERLAGDSAFCADAGSKAREYCLRSTGATRKILDIIFE